MQKQKPKASSNFAIHFLYSFLHFITWSTFYLWLKDIHVGSTGLDSAQQTFSTTLSSVIIVVQSSYAQQ